jgi:hypothetical protein
MTRLSISMGGTGADTPSGARQNLQCVGSDPTGITGAQAVENIVWLEQAAYDALVASGAINTKTLYLITGP